MDALRRLVPYLRPARLSLIAALAAVLASTLAALASTWLLKDVIDGLLHHIDRGQLARYALAIFGLALVDGCLRYQTRRLFYTLSRRIEYDVRGRLFAHLASLPAAFYETTRTGALMARVSEDTSAVRTMLSLGVMNFATYVLWFVLPLAAMLWLDARLTIIAVLPFVVAGAATRRINRAMRGHFGERQAQWSELSAVLQEGLSSIRVLKACRHEAADFARFSRANDDYAASNNRLIASQASSYATLRFSFFLSTVLVLWFGGRDVIDGRLTLGQLAAFGRYQTLLGWPITGFGWVMNLMHGGLVSWRRLLDLFDADVAGERARPVAVAAPLAGARVEARRLSFRYPDAIRPTLTDVSFSVRAGQVLAIVGPTGSGKSTLISLLCGQRPVPPGMLFVDGHDVAALPPRQLRRAVSLAARDAFIFGDTIGGNIAFGLGGDWASPARRAATERAAEVADLFDDISDLPDGFATAVGERGVTLSGGQRQRLALARAVVTNAPIVLLDDALSAVDAETERRILSRLRAVGRSRIAIIVAHRVSTVRDADHILVLDRGRIVEHGGHAQLQAAGGVYAAMCRRQSIEQQLADC